MAPPPKRSNGRRGPGSKRYLTHGALLAALSLLEIFAALSVAHDAGVVAGCVGVAGAIALLSVGATLAELEAAAGAAAAGRGAQPPALKVPRGSLAAANAATAAVATLLLVRAVSTDPRSARASGRFPAACLKPQGCARVAYSNPHRSGDHEPVRLRTSLDGAQGAVLAWMATTPRMDVLYAGPEAAGGGGGDGSAVVVHARALSFLFGFADDVYVRLSCGGGGSGAGDDGRAAVEVQGELRLGVGDLGVNPARNAALLGALLEAAADGALPRGSCATEGVKAATAAA